MEPPNTLLEGEEECQSNESGWTMYIGSPIDHEDGNSDDDDDDDGEVDCYDEGILADAEVESDDSMASDASSGPSHYGLTNFQQKVEEKYHEEEYFPDHKKEIKKQENQVVEKKVEKKQMVFMNNKGKDSVQCSGKVKVKKNHWVGTRK